MIEIAEFTEKKRAVESCIKSLEQNIEGSSIAAEEMKSDTSFLTKANSFRHTLVKRNS